MTQPNPLKSTQFQNRLKKIMQADEDVGKVAAGATYLVACALEAFLDTLVTGAVNLATERNARTLTSAHLKASIVASPILDFCKDSVASAPDLPPPGSDNPTQAPKRRRTVAPQKGGSDAEQAKGRGGRKKKSAAKAAAPLEEGADDDDLVVGDAAEQPPADIAAPTAEPSFLEAAPGQEAEEEDYDA